MTKLIAGWAELCCFEEFVRIYVRDAVIDLACYVVCL